MAEEKESSGSSLKNAIIGLITILVTAIAGVIGKKMMGDDAPAPAAVTAPAPQIIINNSQSQSGGGKGGSAAPAEKPVEKKDGWTKKEPKW